MSALALELEIKKLAASGLLTHNKESVGSLLRGFFEYFAHQGNHVICGGFSWGIDVLSLRTHGGILSKQLKGWVAAKTEITEPTARDKM
jgi:terminal uridylyltransferase